MKKEEKINAITQSDQNSEIGYGSYRLHCTGNCLTAFVHLQYIVTIFRVKK